MAKILQLAFFFSAVSFWTLLTIFRMLLSILKKPRNIFRKTKRQDLPKALLPSNLPEVSHRYVTLKNGIKLHCATSGSEDKPLMLCLHGFPEFWYSWRHQLKEFRDSYFVVAPDLRGYGDSDKPSSISDYNVTHLTQDVKELILALGYEKATLVSHDWGGAICWLFIDFFPDMVEKAVIMNAPHGKAFRRYLQQSRDQFLKSWYMFFFQCPFVPELLIYMDDFKILDNFFLKAPMGVLSGHLTKDDVDAYKYAFANGGMTGPINYYRANVNPLRTTVPPTRPPCPHPVLLIWGTADAALAKPMAELSQREVPNCTVKYIEGASHWVQQDQPEKVNKAMRDFL